MCFMYFICFHYTKKNSATNTTAQQITATDRRLLPHHAAMIPMTSARAADTVLFVAERIAGNVITANVTYGT